MCHPNYIKTVTNNITLVLHLQQPGNRRMCQAFQETTIPEDHKILEWFACLCCFWPAGTIAVFKSNQLRYQYTNLGNNVWLLQRKTLVPVSSLKRSPVGPSQYLDL